MSNKSKTKTFTIISTHFDELITVKIPKGYERFRWVQDSLFEQTTLQKGLRHDGTHTVKEFCKMPAYKMQDILDALPIKDVLAIQKAINKAFETGLYANKVNFKRFNNVVNQVTKPKKKLA